MRAGDLLVVGLDEYAGSSHRVTVGIVTAAI